MICSARIGWILRHPPFRCRSPSEIRWAASTAAARPGCVPWAASGPASWRATPTPTTAASRQRRRPSPSHASPVEEDWCIDCFARHFFMLIIHLKTVVQGSTWLLKIIELNWNNFSHKGGWCRNKLGQPKYQASFYRHKKTLKKSFLTLSYPTARRTRVHNDAISYVLQTTCTSVSRLPELLNLR